MGGVTRSNENIPAVVESPLGLACSLCEKEMVTQSDCLSTKCNHVFHKDCITQWITNTSECPNCKKLCHIRDLVQPNSKTINNPKSLNPRGRGRGSARKSYYTRSNKPREDENISGTMASGESLVNNPGLNFGSPILNFNSSVNNNHASETQPGLKQTHNQSYNTTLQSNRPIEAQNLDLRQLSQLIETSVQRVLSQLNIESPQPPTSARLPSVQNLGRQFCESNSLTNEPVRTSFSNSVNLQPDKITSIIQSWNIRFDGSVNGLRCEEFIYRVQVLTRQNFGGNYNPVEGNLHILLTGKASVWYWRYHQTVDKIDWESFCSALRYQYKDHKTLYDIREEIHNRKQRPNESFDDFYDAISAIADRLPSYLEEKELIEIITRNLRHEIRRELLYVEIGSIAHLKKLCLRRERLYNEENLRRHLISRGQGSNMPSRKIASLESDDIVQKDDHGNDLESEHTDFSVNGITKMGKIIRCWNCDEDGHYWDMCLKERNIFCYGCGAKNVYKPQCVNCSKNLKGPRVPLTNNRTPPQ